MWTNIGVVVCFQVPANQYVHLSIQTTIESIKSQTNNVNELHVFRVYQ